MCVADRAARALIGLCRREGGLSVTHLRQISLEELERRNYALAPFAPTSAPSNISISTSVVRRTCLAWITFASIRQRCSGLRAGSEHGHSAAGGSALPLNPGVEARLECSRDALSEDGPASPGNPQSARGDTAAVWQRGLGALHVCVRKEANLDLLLTNGTGFFKQKRGRCERHPFR